MERTTQSPAAAATANGARDASHAGKHSESRPDVERSQPVVIGHLKKNARERIRVALDEFKGHRYVDVRVTVQAEDGADWPTSKGITVKFDAITDLVDLLRKAEEEARARGLL